MNLSDGDHPDNIVITYNRSNAALELVEDLTKLIEPAEWHRLSLQMLDRDLLSDDEWWAALQRRRNRRNLKNSKLPSYSTRIAAGHLLAAALVGFNHQRAQKTRQAFADSATHLDPWDYKEARQKAFELSDGYCQADGLHHRECPSHIRYAAPGTFITHHVFTRERAKREKLKPGIVDNPKNLIVVWNGHTGLGAGGCHNRIHTEQAAARRLGLLTTTLYGEVPTN